MGNVVHFRPRPRQDESDGIDDVPVVDLITAVDVAIRDLRDIARQCPAQGAREQAIACQLMLEQAYAAALAIPQIRLDR